MTRLPPAVPSSADTGLPDNVSDPGTNGHGSRPDGVREVLDPGSADPHPGATLRALLQRANLSPEQLARELRQLAADLARRLNDKSPYKWFRGAVPRHPWPDPVAHLLTDRHGSQRRGPGLTASALEWLTAPPAGDPARTAGRQVGAEEAADFADITATLRMMDHRHGSGLVLPQAQSHTRFLTGILRDSTYTTDAGIHLHAASAELHCLTGCLHHDSGYLLSPRPAILARRPARRPRSRRPPARREHPR
jgi:hypothetical protein